MRALLLAGLAFLALTQDRPSVLTTFYPTTYMVERIAGEAVDLRCITPTDEDPATWRPDRATLRALQSADLVVLNGAEFEKWPQHSSLRLASRVETSAGFKSEWREYGKSLTHSHGTRGEHVHKGIDGHTWLDPMLAQAQAQAILEALKKQLPTQSEAFERGFKSLARDLAGLDRELRALGAQPEGTVLLASHPAYNYIAHRYGWRVVNLDLDPSTAPTADQMAELREILDETPADYLLWESVPVATAAELLASTFQVTSIVFSPCEAPLAMDGTANPPDYLARMRQNIERIRPAFAQ